MPKHKNANAPAAPEITTNYVEQFLPQSIIEKLESGAFQSLCTHLRERSDEVPNMELMTVSGFCRNCLCKVRLHVLPSWPGSGSFVSSKKPIIL